MINLIEDVSILTDVSETNLKKLLSVSTYSIGHAVYESLCERKDLTSIDVGIGKLEIKCEEDKIYYRFTPSSELENMLIQTITSNASPILSKIDTKLQDKIDRAYKELL